MKRTRSLRIAGVLVGLALFAAACGDDDDAADAAATRAATSRSTRSPTSARSPATPPTSACFIRDGAKVAVEEFNAAHDDIQITLEEFDTQGDPAQAPGQFDKYVADESILGVVGPAFSGETKAVLPQLEENGLVMVSASATNVGSARRRTGRPVVPPDAPG